MDGVTGNTYVSRGAASRAERRGHAARSASSTRNVMSPARSSASSARVPTTKAIVNAFGKELVKNARNLHSPLTDSFIQTAFSLTIALLSEKLKEDAGNSVIGNMVALATQAGWSVKFGLDIKNLIDSIGNIAIKGADNAYSDAARRR